MDPSKLLAKFTQKIANLNKNETHQIAQIRNGEKTRAQNNQLQLEASLHSLNKNDLYPLSNNIQPNIVYLENQINSKLNRIEISSEQKQAVIPVQEDSQQEVGSNQEKKIFQQGCEQDEQRLKGKIDQNLQKSNGNESENDLVHQIKLKLKKDAQKMNQVSQMNSNLVQKETHQVINKVCKSLPIHNNHGVENQNEDKSNSLTDGRQYDQPFRRKFVKKLMKSISIQKPGRINQLIKNAAYSIEVHLYEVKIWLTSYKLIFSVQRYISQRSGYVTPAEKINVIKKELLNFLLRNKNQKKYRIVKILNYLFQTLGLSDIKTHAWVNEFVNQYSKELRGFQIAQNRSNKTKSNDQSSSDDQRQKDKVTSKRAIKIQKRNERDDQEHEMQNSMPSKKLIKTNKKESPTMISQSMNTKRNMKMGEIENKAENPLSPQTRQDISMYPQAFKRKMSERITNQMIKSIDDIIKNKSEEFCLTYNTIKCIYEENGQFVIKTKNESGDLNQMDKKNGVKRTNNETGALQEMRSLNERGIGQRSLHSLKSVNKLSQSSLKNQEMNQNKLLNNGPKSTQSNIPENVQNQNLLQKLQIRLLNYLRLNINCLINVVEKQTEIHMEENKFSEKLKNQVRNQWFCHFLRKNKYSISPDRRVMKILSQPRTDLPNNGVTQRNTQVPVNRPPNSVQIGSNMKQSKPFVDQNGTNKNYFMN